jgi:hypothetical protein
MNNISATLHGATEINIRSSKSTSTVYGTDFYCTKIEVILDDGSSVEFSVFPRIWGADKPQAAVPIIIDPTQ